MLRRPFHTERLVLRPYRSRDYPAWRQANLSRLPPLDRWDRGPSHPKQATPAIFRKMLAHHRQQAAADLHYVYAVFRKEDAALVGVVDLFVIARGAYQLGNVGYLLHNRHRGQGYGREATRGLLEIGFGPLGLHRLEACIDPDNRASLRLARAVGMPREGLRRAYFFEAGRWVDQILFVAIPEDLGLVSSPPPRGARR